MENELKNIEIINADEILLKKENEKYNMEVEIKLFHQPDINSKIIHTLSNQYIRRMMSVTEWT